MDKTKIEDLIKKFQLEIHREINRKPADQDFIKTLEDRIRELKMSLR
jgi:hypothetical protein